jgi:tRNA threonylcarbamoyladenosine biosynthesis protein TsaB
MSYILGVDTSSTILSLGLIKDCEPELSITRFVKNSHAEHIGDVVKSFLDLADIKASEISKVGVVTGPGSFTGLRIGISFLKGMFIIGDTVVTDISTLEAVATSLSVADGKIKVALDARQDNLFTAEFERKDGETIRISSDQKVTKDEFYNSISDNETIVYDGMGFTNSTVFDELSKMKNSINIVDCNISRGITVAKIAESRDEDSGLWTDFINIFPNYMQESYAERNRKK